MRWRCLQSGSRVNLTDSNIGPLTGLGYVECLEMTIKPWELPIDELRWGRFVSKTDQIVWIEWRGECPHLMIYHNGLQVSGGSISEEAVQLGDGLVLELTDQLVLREGRIGSTALASMTILKRIVPRRILKIYERKWRSRGVLRREGAELCRGWIIHEVVKF